MNSFFLLLLASFFMLFSNTFAAEIEKHFVPVHGGIIKKISNGILEIVNKNEQTDIYLHSKNLKDPIDRRLVLNAIAHVKGRDYPLELSFENQVYSIKPTRYLKNEKNYILKLSISFDGIVENTQIEINNK